jgi:hypothetical protein
LRRSTYSGLGSVDELDVAGAGAGLGDRVDDSVGVTGSDTLRLALTDGSDSSLRHGASVGNGLGAHTRSEVEVLIDSDGLHVSRACSRLE